MRVPEVDLSEFEPRDNKKKQLGSVEVGADGGELTTGEMNRPILLSSDWNSVLEGFGLDPRIFYVVDDTVRMSKWQQSKRTDDGDRDIVWLYSYKARFSRRTHEASPVDIETLRAKIDKWRPRTKSKPVDGAPCTFVVCWADWQIGKSAGGGVEATVQRIQDSFIACNERKKELSKRHNVAQVAVINMGDPTEGCDGNYTSQLFSVELTQRAQLGLTLDLWTQGVTALDADLFASVLCNHGEWKRNGGAKSVTTDSDNVGGFLGDTLKRVFDGKDGPQEWHVAYDEFVQIVNMSGVEVGLTHGHKIVGKEFEWLRGQSQRLLHKEKRYPKLWVTAHVHHAAVEDFGPFWRLQCPSNDGGSKWYTDMTGKWATPGTMTFLVGEHDRRGWSDMEIL